MAVPLLSIQKQDLPESVILAVALHFLFAFDQLFAKYSKKLYYFAKGYLDSKEDAESLVQEVFLKIG